MRILVVENNPARASLLEMSLSSKGFNPYVADAADEAFDLASLYDYDVILMNLGVYGSRDVLTRLRNSRIHTPVICLVNVLDPDETAALLTEGADDVMGLPFHRVELFARLTAVVRRSKGHSSATIETGPLIVDLDSKSVTVHGAPVHLTGKEYGMVELLSLRKGSTLTKEHFLNHLYGGMDEPEVKIVDVFVCKLRKKLAEAGADGLISTVWGRGYCLKEPDSREIQERLKKEDEIVQ